MTEALPPVAEGDLDRLVDGATTPAEQRVLLQRLEREPDGWRRLALAFLEAQALRASCAGLVSAPAFPAQPASSPPVRRSAIPRVPGLAEFVCLAASLVIAFALGARFNQRPAVPLGMPRPALPLVDAPPETTASPALVGKERVRVQFDGDAEAVDVPVVEADSQEVWRSLAQQATLPASVREAVREAGHRVEERRQWVEVDLADGRTGYLPVSELIFTSAGPQDYQ